MPSHPIIPGKKEAKSYDFGALWQLESFVAYLQDSNQTNALQRFNDYSIASLASHISADLGVTFGILQRLRDGRTEQAYELLEGHLDCAITGFVSNYRELPASVRDREALKILQYARDYRAQFPFKHRYPIVDNGVAEAFKILDEAK